MRINVTVLQIEREFFWFADPDDFEPSTPLDISNIIEAMTLEVPTLNGKQATVRLHGPFASRKGCEKAIMQEFDLASWGTVQ